MKAYFTALPLVLLSLQFLIVSSLAINSCPSKGSYEGFSAISVIPKTETHLQLLASFLKNPCEAFLFWPDSIRRFAKNIVVISESSLGKWTRVFPASVYTVITGDLASLLKSAPAQKKIYLGRPPDPELIPKHLVENDVTSNNATHGISFKGQSVDQWFYQSYYTLDILQQKWINLSTLYSESIELKIIGQSHENRSIYALFVGHTNASKPRRILINAMFHAREWVTPPVATYLSERLAVAKANSIEPYASLLDDVQVIIVPVANPDGYEYSATEDRLWRKNRRPGSPCVEVDLNRNWDLDFDGSEASSVHKCDDVYKGPFAFSEPEAQSLRDLIITIPGITLHLDIHSYSQLVLGPWSYTKKVPPNLDIITTVGYAIAKDISQENGVRYLLSLSSKDKLIYLASGTMCDWAFSKGVLSYGLELRPSAFDPDSFLLPENEILPTCEEVFASMQRLLYYARNNSNLSSSTQSPTGSSVPSTTLSPTFTPILWPSVSPELSQILSPTSSPTSSTQPSLSLSSIAIAGIGLIIAVVLIVLITLIIIFLRSCRAWISLLF